MPLRLNWTLGIRNLKSKVDYMWLIILFIVLLFGCIIAVAMYLGISLAKSHIKTDNEKIDQFVKSTIYAILYEKCDGC